MSVDLKALIERSASTDLPYLIHAKEGAKKRMKDHPTKDNIEAFRKASVELDKAASGEDAPPGATVGGGRLFAKRDEALAYLRSRGFKIGRTKFHGDCKRGLVPTNASGQFEEAVLLGYAAALPTVAKEEDLGVSGATRDRMAADAELKQILARRNQLKLDRELGLIMPRADHERDLAVRAQFFRGEIEGRDRRLAPKLVDLVIAGLAALDGVSAETAVLLRDAAPGLVPGVHEFLSCDAEELMDAWAADREFVVELDDPAPDFASGGADDREQGG